MRLLTGTTRTAAIATAAALVAVATVPAAQAAPSSLKGTVTWTTTVTLNDDQRDEFGFGDLRTGTTTWSVAMKIKLAKANGTSMADVGSSYTGTFTDNRVTQERSNDGTVNCTITSAGTGSAGGKLPKRPTSTTPPALFSTLHGSRAITLTPLLRYTGTQTTTYAGVGLSPCQSGAFTDPIDGSLAPTYSSDWICYPAGSSKRLVGASAGAVVGAWSAKKKGYVFNCSKSWNAGDGQTITTSIKGLLK
jgi:hypothetical protein